VTRLPEHHLLPTYARAPVTFVEGDGCWLTDDNGERYLDFAGGIAVVGLGHRHPASTRAAHEQLDRLWHTSNPYWTVPMMELAKRLSDRFSGAQAFFCNSGAEAVEAAIKYARKATGKAGIVALEGSFHGRTTGGLSITGQPAKREAFEPLLGQVSFAFLNNPLSLHAAALADTGLIILEPIQGEGGVHPLDPEFAAAARALADELEALLCFDEVQTGVGRTGTFFGFEGMVVHTARTSKEAARGQTATIEFLLLNHPLDCPVCDKGGECPLQDLSFRYGPGSIRLTPPLTVSTGLVDQALATLREALA
jgi:acetylornithine/N-succinyldiaminopimelate aminotransferase